MPGGRPKLDVVVLGAGAAGIAAARALHDAGLEVLILEARERVGGRVFTRRDAQSPVPIELGAEFIHGSAPLLERLLREAGLTSFDVVGRRWTATGRRLRPLDDFWDRLERVMGRLRPSGTDRSFQDFLDGKPGGRRLAADRRLARVFVEGFHAADPRRISARALALGGSPGGDRPARRQGRVVAGYDRAIDWMAAPLASRIQCAAVVARVRWTPGHVVIEVRHPTGATRFAVEARAAIVALPLGVLKAAPGELGAVEFEPALVQKQRVLERLASGSIVRVTLRLRERVWASKRFGGHASREALDTLSFLHSTREEFPVWWTTYPMRTPLIVGWRGGPGARSLAQLPRDQLAARAVASLARQLDLPPRRLQSRVDAIWAHDWEHDPFARGAYSYSLVGGADAPRELARSVRQTLFFAGEATAGGEGTGTVEGAIASGRRAAAQVLRAL